MDQQSIAQAIADLVVRDTQFWIAVVGLVGTALGAIIAVIGVLVLHWLQNRKLTTLTQP